MEQTTVSGDAWAASGLRRRYTVALAGLIVGTGLSIGLFLFVRHWERNQRWVEFQDAAGDRAEALRRHLDERLEALHSVAGLYGSSQEVERGEFRAFVQMALRRHPDVQAIQWLPRVPQAERANWEAEARREAQKAGVSNFLLRQPGPDGELVPAAERPEYFPVYFVETPDPAHQAALGLDHAADAIRLATMQIARGAGSPVATPPLRLSRFDGPPAEPTGLVIYLPIYENGRPGVLQGFAAAVFRGDRLLAPPLSGLRPAAIDVALLDGTGDDPPQLVARLGADGNTGTALPADAASGWTQDLAIDRAGRNWVLRCQATAEFVAGGRFWQSWAALAAGLVLTVLGTGYLNNLVRRTIQIERRVHNRTADLAEANRALAAEVAERRKTEEELRISRARAQQVLDTAHDAFVAMNVEGRIIGWNNQAEATFGWSRAEALGRPLAELIIPPQHRDDHRRGLKRFLETGVGPVLNRRIELTALHRDGREFPVELTISPLRLGASLVFNAFIHDITARKQVQRELVRAKETAETASRSKSEFLANMSHESRTPMNAVIGMTELALDTDLTPEQREYLQTVKSSAESLLTVINDILDFSKIEAGRLDLAAFDFDLRDCLGEALKALAVRAHEKRLELASRVAPDVPDIVCGDPTRLRQIIMNLVGNAIKFTDRGEVVVEVARSAERGARNEENQHAAPEDSDRSALRAPSSALEGVELNFSVRDTGIGISATKQRVIFDPFVQVDGSTTRKYGGTGLGLSITSRLVEMMGGTIGVESAPGRGSVFRFTARFGAPSGGRPAPPPLRPARLEGLPVLIVDDNATNRRILLEVLTNWRMKPSAVDSGAAALRALTDAHAAGEPFALVLIDGMMPEMDGFDLAERIRAHPELAGATVMMLTSSDRPGNIARCRALGFSGYLIKPIKQSELLDGILTALQLGIMGPEPTVPAPAAAKRLRPLRILLAEDNVVNQRLAMRVLEKHGHRVVVANNGREVLELLFPTASGERQPPVSSTLHEAIPKPGADAPRAPRPFDLILMDVQMPEIGGFEATAKIREREQKESGHIPIVAMTAHAMKGDRERCLGAGMDGYVPKPVQAETLFQAMAEALGVTALQTPPPEPMPEPALAVDRAALLARVGGDDQLLREIVGLFLEDAPRLFQDIRKALASGDAEGLRVAAHGLKGAAANFGANRVSEIALQLEMLGRDGIMAGAETVVAAGGPGAQLAQLAEQLDRLSTALAGLVSNAPSA